MQPHHPDWQVEHHNRILDEMAANPSGDKLSPAEAAVGARLLRAVFATLDVRLVKLEDRPGDVPFATWCFRCLCCGNDKIHVTCEPGTKASDDDEVVCRHCGNLFTVYGPLTEALKYLARFELRHGRRPALGKFDPSRARPTSLPGLPARLPTFPPVV